MIRLPGDFNTVAAFAEFNRVCVVYAFSDGHAAHHPKYLTETKKGNPFT